MKKILLSFGLSVLMCSCDTASNSDENNSKNQTRNISKELASKCSETLAGRVALDSIPVNVGETGKIYTIFDSVYNESGNMLAHSNANLMLDSNLKVTPKLLWDGKDSLGVLQLPGKYFIYYSIADSTKKIYKYDSACVVYMKN